MRKRASKLKATISYIIVALLFVCILLGGIQIAFSNQIREAISLVNMVSVVANKEIKLETKINSESKRLQQYPKYATQYATIQIESLNVNLPLYYGETLSILRNGVGQSMEGYFPGEGGSIVCMAHNTSGFLKDLQNIKIGAIIKIKTSYGEYQYKVYDTKIVHQSQIDAIEIQDKEERLMLYTCYPTNSIGHATHRFITYAKLVSEE